MFGTMIYSYVIGFITDHYSIGPYPRTIYGKGGLHMAALTGPGGPFMAAIPGPGPVMGGTRYGVTGLGIHLNVLLFAPQRAPPRWVCPFSD